MPGISIISTIITVILLIYCAYSYVSRYKLRQKNEELKYKLALVDNSIKEENSKLRAKYRITHEEEKIKAIKDRLNNKYGNRLVLENKLLEEILLFEKEKAELSKVEFVYEIQKGSEEIMLRFSADESIAFFLNLFDNAIEAASMAEDKKLVSVIIGRSILLKNTYDKDRSPGFNPGETSKESKEKHGFGLGIIRDYCDKKELMLEYSADNEYIVTEIGGKT